MGYRSSLQNRCGLSRKKKQKGRDLCSGTGEDAQMLEAEICSNENNQLIQEAGIRAEDL